MSSVMYSILFAIAISTASGFYIGNSDFWVEQDIMLEDNGWGVEQEGTEPYCDLQKTFLLKMYDENKTLISTTKYILHKYCNI